MPTAACRCCACRRRMTIWWRSAIPRRGLADGATDIVILGTGGSSLGGQTLAQLAGHRGAGRRRLRAPPRLHFMDNLDADTFGTLLAKLPHATTRFVAISKSGGTAETLMQTIAALSAVKAEGLETRIPDIFLGLTEPAKTGKRNGLRDLLGKFHVPMLDHEPASAAASRCSPMSACCRRRCSVSISLRCAKAPAGAGAGAGEKAGGAGAGRSRRRARRGAGREQGQKSSAC